MKTLEQSIYELFAKMEQPEKEAQAMVELAHSYVEKDEQGMAQFIADLLNEHYRTDKFTELCLKY